MVYKILYVISAVLIIGLAIICVSVSYSHKLQNQFFAERCNESGGVARDIDGMIQCVGERP